MAEPSRKPTASQYGVKLVCEGCGRRLYATEPLWFSGLPKPETVRGWCNHGWCPVSEGAAPLNSVAKQTGAGR
jgi:hypothetical protein